MDLYQQSFPQPTQQMIRSNSVNPIHWIRYQAPQQMPYRHQFIQSAIPTFRQQIASQYQPKHLFQRPSNAIVIIDPKTKQPIELVKSSSLSNPRTNQNNRSFNKIRRKVSDTNQYRDLSSNHVAMKTNDPSINTINSNNVNDEEVPKNTELQVDPVFPIVDPAFPIVDPVFPIVDPVFPIVVPIVELENVVNDEKIKVLDKSINIPDSVDEVIMPTTIDQTCSSVSDSPPSKAVKSKVTVANTDKCIKLSNKNERNKRRRATSNKQPYLKSKKGINETKIEICFNDKEIESESKRKAEIIVHQHYNVIRYGRADLLLLMSSRKSNIFPSLDSRFVKIQTKHCSLMKTLTKDLKNVTKPKIELCEVNSSLIATQSCPSNLKYPQGMIRISLSETKIMNTIENAWTPNCRKTNVEISDSLEQEIVKKFRSVLNKLCPENFNKMLEEVKVMDIHSSSVLNECIRLLFEKAIADICFAPTYALMCASIRELQKDSFLTYLVAFCQEEFERFQKGFDNDTDEEGKKKFHRDTIGTVKFIGELYNIKIVDDKIAGECIKLLMDPKTIGDVKLESLCHLLKTIGSRIEENNQIPELVDDCFKQLNEILTNKTVAISPRIRFAVMDLIELKKSCWKVRRITEAPKKLNEIVVDMQKEDVENAELTRRFCQKNRIPENCNDTNNRVSSAVDQIRRNGNQRNTKVEPSGEINVDATIRNADNPNNINNNNTHFEIKINNSTKIDVNKVQSDALQTNNIQEILKIKKLSYKAVRHKTNRSIDRANKIIIRDKRDVKIIRRHNIESRNSIVNNRCNESYDDPRPNTCHSFQHSHLDERYNNDPRSRNNVGNNLNRQQNQQQSINSRGYNNRRDSPRNDNNQHGDPAYDNSFKGCIRSFTNSRNYNEPVVKNETWRSKKVGESIDQNYTSREPINMVRQSKSNPYHKRFANSNRFSKVNHN